MRLDERCTLAATAVPGRRVHDPAPGHGTDYNDVVTIQLRDFITAITDEGTRAWPDFDDALAVHHVIDAALEANRAGHWVRVAAN